MVGLDKSNEQVGEETVGKKIDTFSDRPLNQIRDMWKRTIEALTNRKFIQFYIVCPRDGLEAIVEYLNQAFQAEILEKVELDIVIPICDLKDSGV